jgi:TRAP-type uncharacterized transport system substrate-binding protein
MSAQSRLRMLLWRRVAPVVGLAAIGLAVYFYFYFHGGPSEKAHRLDLSAGDALGIRHQLAQLLQTEVAGQGLRLELHETKGSEEALAQVNDHVLDLALVQGGLCESGYPNVRQVATLHVEPLHLLVKKELAEGVARHLNALDGKTVNLGPTGSGTHALASEVLAFAGLRPRAPGRTSGYIPMELTRHQLYDEPDRGRLPDAVFMDASMPANAARFLVQQRDYRLVPLPFGEAFALEPLNPPGSAPLPEQQIDKARTCATTIPAFTYSLDPPVPAAPLPTLGTRLLLVAHKDVDRQAVRKIVEATFTGEFGKLTRPMQDAKYVDMAPEYPWHEGTLLYQERNSPPLSGPMMDSAHKAFAILAAAVSGLFVLWQWAKMRSQFTRDKGFSKYIEGVTRIEEQAGLVEFGRSLRREQLLDLRGQLARLKTEALDRFTAGELAGHELLSGFLVQVNHTSDFLTQILLRHEEALKNPAAEEEQSLIAHG